MREPFRRCHACGAAVRQAALRHLRHACLTRIRRPYEHTTSGMREFIFYTRDSEAARLVLEALRSEVTSHELQSYIAEDPKWALYREFA